MNHLLKILEVLKMQNILAKGEPLTVFLVIPLSFILAYLPPESNLLNICFLKNIPYKISNFLLHFLLIRIYNKVSCQFREECGLCRIAGV